MKTLVAMLIGLVVTLTAYPAAAYVVVVTTSVPAQSVADDDAFEAALKSAIDDVLRHVVAFSPTFVTVQGARAVGGRCDADPGRRWRADVTRRPSSDCRRRSCCSSAARGSG
jgi:hypothetical protein